MSGRKQKPFILENIEIEAAAAEGKAIAKYEGKVIFIPFAAPGDVADIQVGKQKKSFAEGKLIKLRKASSIRNEPVCIHFGTCGGCKWQHVQYTSQLQFKSEQVKNDLKRIGKVEVNSFLPIIESKETLYYRNKLEFTFSNKAWEEHFDKNNPGRIPALGFHIPGMFDKVLDLEVCHLAPDYANTIRETVKSYAIEHDYSFYDIRQQNGFLRNLMLRCTQDGKWMLVLIVGEDQIELISKMFNDLIPILSQVDEWCYVINTKKNDSWSDLDVKTFKGIGYLTESLDGIQYKIRPQSFFQTNAQQALKLYRVTKDFAALTGVENVYDLYCGTGSIALFLASNAKQVIGIEYVEAAITDANENAKDNSIHNATFYAGDMKLVLNNTLIDKHGKADVIITDPPRDGMHPDVVNKIIELQADRIVYVSCNPATQARDLAMLDPYYSVDKVQPVDMFPHTHHVESVALLIKRSVVTIDG